MKKRIEIFMKIMLVEDYYDSLSQESKDKIDSNEKLRDLVRDNKVSKSIIDILDNEDDIDALTIMAELNNNRALASDIYFKLLSSQKANLFGNGDIVKKLDEDALKLLLMDLSYDNYEDIASGDSPLFEFVKEFSRQYDGITLDYITLRFIDKLHEDGKISDLDLKNPTWLLNKNIYVDEDSDGRIYKIKLYLFFEDNDMGDFKDISGNSLGNVDWKDLIQMPSKDLYSMMSKYSNDAK